MLHSYQLTPVIWDGRIPPLTNFNKERSVETTSSCFIQGKKCLIVRNEDGRFRNPGAAMLTLLPFISCLLSRWFKYIWNQRLTQFFMLIARHFYVTSFAIFPVWLNSKIFISICTLLYTRRISSKIIINCYISNIKGAFFAWGRYIR